jgi:hypothetical protein
VNNIEDFVGRSLLNFSYFQGILLEELSKKKKKKFCIHDNMSLPRFETKTSLIYIFSTDTNLYLLQLIMSSSNLGARSLKGQCNVNISFPAKYFQPVSSLLTPKLPSGLRAQLGKVNLL